MALSSRRFEPLDVLRGLAVLGMGLSGMVPYRTLPAWMYHAQIPPPSRDFSPNVYGITWVDLVFPFFLFSMGAAIPLALGRRLEAGESHWSVIKVLLGRGLLLAAYALIGEHLRPFSLSDNPDAGTFAVTLAGFFLLGFILIRWPDWVAVPWRRWLTALGWVGSALAIAFWIYPDSSRGFSNYRNDVILMVLANVAVSGGVLWIFTRGNPRARLVWLAAVAAIFLTNESPGLSHWIWNWDPTQLLPFRNGPYGRFLPILYHFEFHKYLLIVLAGTFAGDAIRRALAAAGSADGATPCQPGTTLQESTTSPSSRVDGPSHLASPESPATSIDNAGAVPQNSPRKTPQEEPFPSQDNGPIRWAPSRHAVVALWGPFATFIACVGLLARDVIPATLLLATFALLIWRLLPLSHDPIEDLSRRLINFGHCFLLVGLLCEPLGGGIRKDPATFSYFLVTSGLSFLCLASLTILWRSLQSGKTWRLVADTGTNPILGYLVITNLIWGIVGLTGLEALVNSLTENPWLILLYAAIKTFFVAIVTAWFTRRKIFLRA